MDEKRRQAEREERLRARKRDSQWKTVIMCVVIGAVVLVGLFIFFELKGATVKNEDGKITLNIHQGFPYKVENTSSSENYIKATNDKIVLLNGNLLEFINPANGKSVKSEAHFFSSPVFDVNGKYVLTYDQGRNKMRIDTAAKTIFQNELEENIITAAIGADGTFATATVTEKGNSKLTVYSKSLNELFTWNSTEGYIIAVEVSTDGNYVAVATTASPNGALNTKIHIFEVKKQAETASFEVAGASAPVLRYVSGNDLFVITATGCSYISNNKEWTDLLQANQQTVSYYSFSSGGTLSLIYSQYDNAASGVFVSYSKNGKQIFQKELAENVKAVYTSNSAVALLFADRVETFNKKGEPLSKTQVTPYARGLVQFGSKLYVLNVDQLECIQTELV